jgi:hypothetical protein
VDVGVGADVGMNVGETFTAEAIDVVVGSGSEVVHCVINKTVISNAEVARIRSNTDLIFIVEVGSVISNIRLFSFR